MNDLISRWDAIEAAKDLLKYHGQNLTEELINYFSTNAMNRIPAVEILDVDDFDIETFIEGKTDCCGCDAEHGEENYE